MFIPGENQQLQPQNYFDRVTRIGCQVPIGAVNNQRLYFPSNGDLLKSKVVAIAYDGATVTGVTSGAQICLCDRQGNTLLEAFPVFDLDPNKAALKYIRQFDLDRIDLGRSYIVYNTAVSPITNQVAYFKFYYRYLDASSRYA